MTQIVLRKKLVDWKKNNSRSLAHFIWTDHVCLFEEKENFVDHASQLQTCKSEKFYPVSEDHLVRMSRRHRRLVSAQGLTRTFTNGMLPIEENVGFEQAIQGQFEYICCVYLIK